MRRPPRVEIVPCTFDHMADVSMEIRTEDEAEMRAAFPDINPAALSVSTLEGSRGTAWAAIVKSSPAMVFGFRRATFAVASAWSWGTRDSSRAAPAVTSFIQQRWPGLFKSVGVRRVEIRPMAGHRDASRWLQRIGFKRECDCPEFGANGEPFQLWAWTTPWHLPTDRSTKKPPNT